MPAMVPLIAVVEVRGSKLIISTVGGAVGGVLAIIIILVLITIIDIRLGRKTSPTLWVYKLTADLNLLI